MPSPRALALVQSRVEFRRRLGQFVVGTFAGACALFAPRLTAMVGQPAGASFTIDALGLTFLIAATLLSVLVGGVALILEWDGTRSPKDTFMAALGVPALLSGVFSTATVSQETRHQAEIVKSISDDRAKDEGIVVEDTPPSPVAPSVSQWPPLLQLMPTVYAAEAQDGRAAVAVAPQGGLGVRYRQVRYWVVLLEERDRTSAERRASALGTRYGSVTVQSLGTTYAVTAGANALPYSDAVSRAVELKKQSEGTMVPKLVRAG